MDSKSSGLCARVGSIPTFGTNNNKGFSVFALTLFCCLKNECKLNILRSCTKNNKFFYFLKLCLQAFKPINSKYTCSYFQLTSPGDLFFLIITCFFCFIIEGFNHVFQLNLGNPLKSFQLFLQTSYFQTWPFSCSNTLIQFLKYDYGLSPFLFLAYIIK